MLNLIQKLRDPLYKNSIFLMLSSITGAGTGFIFWVVAARFYSAEDVGLASAIVSAMRMIGMLSVLGLDLALIRYIPEKENKSETINSALVVTALVSFVLSVLFVLMADYVSPSLSVIKELKYIVLFMVFTISFTLVSVQGWGVFVAFRKAKYTFIQNTSTFLRLFILPFLVSFGAVGIFISFGAGMVLAVILAFILMFRYMPHKINAIEFRELKDMIHFSFGVYLARIFENLPGLVLPIMVLNVLGAKQNAYFFVAWWVMFFVTMVARMTSMSLLAEGSYEPERLKERISESVKFVIALTLLAVFVIYVFGDCILHIFGKEYAKNSLDILRILLIGCIFYAFNVLYAGAMMVKKMVRRVIAVYGGIALVTIVLGYFLMNLFGINGVGYAWILGNFIVISSTLTYEKLF